MGKIGGAIVGFVMIIGLILVIICTNKIPAGYAGVVYNINGGIEGKTLSQGWRVVNPTKKVTKYTIGWEQSYMTANKQGDSEGDESFEVPTKDGKGLRVEVAFNYKFDEARLPQTFTNFKGRSGEEIKKIFIKPNMQAWIKEVTPVFYMTEIIGEQRGKVNQTITKAMQERFDKYGIIMDNVSLVDVKVDKETDKAIQAKIEEQQKLETAKIKAETAKVEANRKKDVAKIEAETAKVEAQGKSDAALIEAEAEAKANKMISDSLTDKLIEAERIKKWNGTVPQVQGAGSTIVDTRGLSSGSDKED